MFPFFKKTSQATEFSQNTNGGRILSTRKILVFTAILIFFTATTISFFYTQFIRNFLKENRAETVASLIEEQARRHLHADHVFSDWQQTRTQEELKNFKEEIVHTYRHIVGLKIHSPEGMLIWTDIPNEPLGTFLEKSSVLEAQAMGKVIKNASDTTKIKLEVANLTEVYTPIKNNLGDIIAVGESYINQNDVVQTTVFVALVLWLVMLLTAFIIITFFYLTLQNRDNEIISQAKNLEILAHDLERKVYDRTQELALEKNKLEVLLANLGEGMVATDTTGIITMINPAATHIIGTHAHDLLGKKIFEAIPFVDEQGAVLPNEKRVCTTAMTQRATTTQEGVFIVKKDGRKTAIKVTASPIKTGSKTTGVIIIFSDISKEKEAEEARRNFISIASHQLRTPLSGAQWLLETLKKQTFGTLTPKQEEYINEIYTINERMASLVHDILNLLKVESNVTIAKKESTSIQSIFDTIFKTLNAAASRKKISLKIPEALPRMVNTDPLLLRTILETLVSNAISYSRNESEVIISFNQTPSEYTLSVQDFGIGIPRDAYPQVFDRFYRAPNAKDFDANGTGLGLYIAYLLAQKINATLSFESEVGKGTTFHIHLPLA